MNVPNGHSTAARTGNFARGIALSIAGPQPPSALLVSAGKGDDATLAGIFRAHSNRFLRSAGSREEALIMLLRHPTPVVICEAAGDWRSLLEIMNALPARPRLILASHDAGEVLWAEVLGSGVFDVLSIPWDAKQVFRVVSLAWRSWRLAGQAVAQPVGEAAALVLTAAAGG